MKTTCHVTVFACLLSACGGATTGRPAVEPKPTQTTSATAVAAVAPEVAPTLAVVEAPAEEPAEPMDPAAAESLARAQAFAKSYVWNETPTLDRLPKGDAVGAIGDAVFVISDVRLSVDEHEGTLNFSANGGESQMLGFTIIRKGGIKTGGKYTGKMDAHRGYFQVPKPGKSVTTKKSGDTMSIEGEHAYVIEVTKFSMEAGAKEGKASGRFNVVYRAEGEAPQMWAAGTFVDAPVFLRRR